MSDTREVKGFSSPPCDRAVAAEISGVPWQSVIFFFSFYTFDFIKNRAIIFVCL